MHRYVGWTWLWTSILHPFVLLGYFGVSDLSPNVYIVGYLIVLLFYSFIFSLPSLLMSLGVVYLIPVLRLSSRASFFCWLTCAPLIAFLNFVLICLFFGMKKIDFGFLEMAFPAILTVVFVVIARYNYFLKAITAIKEKQHETTMV